jgi:hypothetical protein
MTKINVDKTFEGDILLEGKETAPLGPVVKNASLQAEEKRGILRRIIEEINKRFGIELTEVDRLMMTQIREEFAMDDDMVLKIRNKSIENFKYAFEKGLQIR